MSNSRKLPPREPDTVELAFKAELEKGCPGCGSRVVTGKFRGRWEYTLRCKPECSSHTGKLGEFTGHSIAAAAAERAGLVYRAVDGTSGGVVLAGLVAGG